MLETVKRYSWSVRSRTVLSIIALIIINGIPTVQDELRFVLGESTLNALNTAIGIAGIYFRTNPRIKL